MNQLESSVSTWSPIDLAREPDFQLGPMHVRPARCEVEAHGVRQVLQRRTMQVLVALAASSSPVVSHEELNARCWGGLWVGEDAIGRCIGQLRRLARQWSPPVFEIVTTVGVGYRLEAERAEPAEGARRLRGGVWPTVVGALLVLGLGAATLAWRQSAVAEPVGLSVTAFEPLGAAASSRTLGKAIDAELLNQLNDSQIPAQTTPKPASVFSGKGDGLELGGVVQDDGHEARATVRLLDASSQTVIWTARFERPSGDTRTLPSAVAAQAADMISLARFAKTASPPLKDDAALTTLLAAHSAIRWDSSHDWARRIELARDLTRMAPSFAFGRSMLAFADINAVRLNVAPDQSDLLKEDARRQAAKAIALDPDDAGGYYALALIEPGIAAREAIVSRGLAHNGHPAAQLGALNTVEGHVLLSVGRVREALPYVDRALALDRLSPLRTSNAIVTYAVAGRVDYARDLLAKALERWPDQPDVLNAQLYLWTFFETPEDALRQFPGPGQAPGNPARECAEAWRAYMTAKATHSRERAAQAAASIAQLAEHGRFNPRIAILMLAQLGDLDSAFRVFGDLRNDTSDVTGFQYGPAAAPLRADPRFLAVVRETGRLDYWRKTGRLPDICTAPKPEAVCAEIQIERLRGRLNGSPAAS